MGIKVQDQKQMFKLFGKMKHSLDPNELQLSDGNHIGMGLVLSKLLIEQYDGTLDCSSEDNVGSTFAFSFRVSVYEEFQPRHSRRSSKK